jgi:hypothetical protein
LQVYKGYLFRYPFSFKGGFLLASLRGGEATPQRRGNPGQTMNPYYVFVCDKAVCGSSMWHVLWGVPSRMTVRLESPSCGEPRKVDCRVVSLLAMTGESGEPLPQKRKNDCAESVIHNKDSCSRILGSLQGNAQG